MILQCVVPSATLLNIPASRVKTSPLRRWSISTNLASTRRPRGVSQISTVVSQRMPLDGDDVKGGCFEVELKVRDYELDQFGVVNHAGYLNYCQLGRHELFEKIGINIDSIVGAGYALAVTELSLKYIAPLRSRDKFILKVRVTDSSPIRLFFEHLIYKLPNHELIMEAKCTGVWLNKNYRPVRIPPEVRAELVQHLRQEGADD